MVLGIDASNIRAGGGLTHLRGLLSSVEPNDYGFKKVVIWGGDQLKSLPDQPWLQKELLPILNKGLPYRIYWQKFKLSQLAKECDILFAPAGNYTGSFHPFVSMSQNMLVFEKKERARYGFSLTRARLKILNYVQSKSFGKADSILFISSYAKNYILNYLKLDKPHAVINHGISDTFRKRPIKQKNIKEYSNQSPFKILYVSIVDVYKHQNIIVQAVERLYEEGYPIELHLIGPTYKPSEKVLRKTLTGINNADKYIKLKGKVAYEEIAEYYKSADAFAFSSSCENMPNIVIEAMSAGLPIASSNCGPMPEFLKDAAIYYDPVSVESTYKGLKQLLNNEEEREVKANRAFNYAKDYSWKKCAQETFEYLSKTALE